MYYAVIDTNVLVSALLKNPSYPFDIVSLIDTGTIVPLLHSEIIEEYSEVLRRPKFNFTKQQIEGLLAIISLNGIFLDKQPVEEVLPDPKDRVFYEIVMEARKEEDAYLVTGNIKHFPSKPYVVTPKEMIDIISKSI